MNKPMNEKEDCITMMTDSGESVDFYVLEESWHQYSCRALR